MPLRGPKPILTEESKSNIVALITVGSSKRRAACYVGCAHGTIRYTAARDPVFAAQLKKASYEAEFGLVHSIRKASKKEQHWRAAAWLLERSHPQRYLPRSTMGMAPRDVHQLITRLARIVVEEVPVARYRQRIIARLAEIYRNVSGRPPRWKFIRPTEDCHDAS